MDKYTSRRRISRRSVTAVAAATLASLILAGCSGSIVGSRMMGDDIRPVDRKALTEQIFQTCRSETTPWVNRPTSPMSGKCECAAVSFHNYATEAQVDDVRNLWAMYGSGKEFTHKVLGVTENFHSTHCGRARSSTKSVLELTRLYDPRNVNAGSEEMTANGVVMSVESNLSSEAIPVSSESASLMSEGVSTIRADQSMSTSVSDGITRFALSPSALKDRDIVRFVQRKLKGLGFDPGQIDGVTGKQTRKALDAYARSQNMPDGISDEDIMSALVF